MPFLRKARGREAYGSDVHLIDGTLSPLLLKGDTVTLGHEVAGTVAETGAGVTGRQEGDRVVLPAGERHGTVIWTRGADLALDPADPGFAEQVRAATGGGGVEVAFDFAGVPAVREQALGVLAEQGKLVLVGLTDQPLTVTRGTLFSYLRQQILGHYGSEETAVPQLIGLAAGGRLDFSRSISDVLPLESAAEAVERLATKKGDPIRLILRP